MAAASVIINFRTSVEKRDEIDEAATAWGMTRSDWILKLIDDELRRMRKLPRGRTIRVIPAAMRGKLLVGSVSPRLCNHPPAMRSEKSEDGVSRCLACNSEIRPLR